MNKGRKMTQGFWGLARRERGAYPQGSVTSEQRRQPPKKPVRLLPLFITGSLDVVAGRFDFFGRDDFCRGIGLELHSVGRRQGTFRGQAMDP